MTPLSPTPLTDERLAGLVRDRAWHEGRGHAADCWGCRALAAFRELQQARRSLAERDAELLAVTKQLRDSCLDTRSEGEWYEWGCPIATDLRSRIAALEARNAALVEALKKYGRHESHCNKSWQPHYPKCVCGLSAALTEQQGGKT